MQASTLRLLEAAHFTSPQALALAEAIETEIGAAQVVTVPILDSKVHEINARFDRVDLRFGQVETRLGQLDTRLGQLDTRLGQLDTRLGQVETRLGQMEARMADGFYKMAALGLTATGLIITSVFFVILHFKN